MITFFTSPIGLGHATRDIAIAEELKTDILFVSGEGASILLSRKGFKALDVYKPKKFIVESGQLRHAFKWLLLYYLYYKKCKTIAKEILENRNGLIISDEDFASIAVAEEKDQRRVLITDITESHFTAGPASVVEKKMNKSMHNIMQRCDYVIIPEIGDDKDNICYVGPVVRRASADRNTLRKQFCFEKNTILVSGGGTDAGRYLVQKAIEVHCQIQSKLDSELIIVSGPSLKLPDSQEYRNLGFINNMHDLVYAADLVISLAGRSTIDESMAYGTPGIFIPIRNHFEQEQNAARFGFKYEDIFRLEYLIKEKIGCRSNAVDIKGAARAAKIISLLM
ncbi:MAG TPA: glycosyltransferase [Nitrososphaera sp.]|jgi:UDP-N-acetylglucosamine--N-acetylmuramyl-(pentapeptide) pyrophosphoryl-undecaprenol N-acetylglucosamine transferase|nr:glycosyltransferase [Nitrososphaera sp.]